MIELTTEEKRERCQECPHRRNFYCKKHGDEIRRITRRRPTCEGWGNVHTQPAAPPDLLGEGIRLGFCLPNLGMGGVVRYLLALMEAPAEHGLAWAGLAIGTPDVFDARAARRIRRHCPLYSTRDAAEFQGLVEIVPNAAQAVMDRADVVNLWGYTAGNDELDAVDWKKKPMLVVAHGQCEWARRNVSFSLSRAGLAVPVSVSEAAAKCFDDATQAAPAVIYNGLDYTRCAPARDREEIRREWGLEPHHKAVGYIGRLAGDKNPLAAARAVDALPDDFRAIYVGDGVQAEKITAEIKALCGDRALVLPPTDDVGSVLAALDCLVAAAPAEGGPLIAAEAWLAGCPVVATSVGMIPELERDHGPLVYRVPRNPTAGQLAAAVQDALEGDDRMERARRLAWNRLSPSRMVLNYERAIRAALAPPPEKLEPTPPTGFWPRLKRLLKRRPTMAATFGRIYRENQWGSNESASGTGSTLEQTAAIRRELPPLLQRFAVKSFLDLPCGDHHWLAGVNLGGADYLGGDIVPDLIEANRRRHPHRRFEVLDLTAGKLPRADLVFSRDCLVHFSAADIKKAVQNIKASGSRYWLTTTFPGRENKEIATGGWRPVDLQADPFHFPDPLALINENCTERNALGETFTDKSLALFEVAALPDF